MPRSILDVKSSICFLAQSTGSIQQVIIALVYSVNVCQMDIAAVAACNVAERAALCRKKGKEKGGTPLISSSSLTSLLTSCEHVAQRDASCDKLETIDLSVSFSFVH